MESSGFKSVRLLALILCGVGLSVGVGQALDASLAKVFPDAASTKPLQPGTSVPSALIRTVGGQPVDIADLTRASGALLVFYRGGW